jgi:hypothetical protein
MAKSTWKQVKVKVKGQMVTRWTDGKTFRKTKPGVLYPEGLPNILRGLKRAADAANARQRERDFGSSSSSSSSSSSKASSSFTASSDSKPRSVPAGSMNISQAGRKQAEANKAAAKSKRLKAEAAAKAAADKKAAAAKAEADRKARLAKQNSNAPSRAPAPTPSSAAQNLRAGRSPDRSPSKPGKKVYGSTGRKDLKQSSRMASALKNLKVRNYKKKK